MSVIQTSQTSARATAPDRASNPSHPAVSPEPQVDTSNLSPGAAARFEKLIRSIDAFTEAVQNKTVTLPDRR